MNRKNFFRAIGSFPLFGISLTSFAAEGRSGPCQTQRDAEGPYYKADAPSRTVIETQGTTLQIEGTVVNGNDCTTPVANAILDIWHCDNHGEYDLKGFKCRGQIKTDSQGYYRFTSIFPPPYGSRPRHIHFKIRAKGYPELTTQLYFQGDPNIGNDFARKAQKDRVISLTDDRDLKKGTFNIYL